MINDNVLVVIAASAISYGTPLLFAALGELLAERSGVLNLGVEGMMLIGAVSGFWAVQTVGGPGWLSLLGAVLVAAVAGAATSMIHAFLTISLRASQIVSGLALTIFAGASGLSSYIGHVANLGGKPARYEFDAINVFGQQGAPVIGPILLHQNALTYFSWALVVLILFYLYRTRPGLHLRAVGESPATADAMGVNVAAYRYIHVVLGGALAGIGGAFFSLAITPGWIDGMTSGAGWIAIALVIFAFWRPELALVGAYLFGAFSSLGFTLQARQVHLPQEVFSSLPYLMTIVVLVLVSTGWARRRLGAPAALGVPYVREERRRGPGHDHARRRSRCGHRRCGARRGQRGCNPSGRGMAGPHRDAEPGAGHSLRPAAALEDLPAGRGNSRRLAGEARGLVRGQPGRTAHRRQGGGRRYRAQAGRTRRR